MSGTMDEQRSGMMTDWLRWQRTLATMRLRDLRDRANRWLAWRLPPRLVTWCAYRVGAHATQGQWGSTEVPSLTFMDAMQRWDTR